MISLVHAALSRKDLRALNEATPAVRSSGRDRTGNSKKIHKASARLPASCPCLPLTLPTDGVNESDFERMREHGRGWKEDVCWRCNCRLKRESGGDDRKG